MIYRIHYDAGTYSGTRDVEPEDSDQAKAKVRAWVHRTMTLTAYYESYRLEAVGGE
jgi:hypothetical protein